MSDQPPPPVVARPAASLVVLRHTAAPAVLMGMRGAKHRFMPNRLVFPGGAVDPADHDAPAATPLLPDVQRRLEKSADPSPSPAPSALPRRASWRRKPASRWDPRRRWTRLITCVAR